MSAARPLSYPTRIAAASADRVAMSPGITLFISELMAKRLELFRGAMPSTPAIATLANPEKSERGIRSEGSETLTASKPFVGYPNCGNSARHGRSAEKVHQKVPNPRLLHALNHRTTEPGYRRDGHLLGRWSPVFTFKGSDAVACVAQRYLPA